MAENLYFKLTTIPQTEDVEEVGKKELELYFNKYNEVNKLSSLGEAVKDYYANAGKNPLFGKIHSITVGFIAENTARVMVLKGDEKSIIQEFVNLTNTHFKSHQVTAWNFSFVLPFLRVRATKNNIFHGNFHKDLVDLSKKAWTITGYDLFDTWKGLGWYQSSLEEVAELTLNIPTNFVDGKDVYNVFKGSPEKLDESSIEEVITMINIHRAIKGEDKLTESSSQIKELGDVKKVEQPLLVELYHSKSFNQEVKDALKAMKILKKDKPTVMKIVLAHYKEQVDIMARNKKELQEINKERTEEITEFFKTL